MSDLIDISPEAVAGLRARRDAFDEFVQSMTDREMTTSEATLVKSAKVSRDAIDASIAIITAQADRIAALEAEVERLRKAGDGLAKVASHGFVCNAFGPTPLCCSCGLTEALTHWQEVSNG